MKCNFFDKPALVLAGVLAFTLAACKNEQTTATLAAQPAPLLLAQNDIARVQNGPFSMRQQLVGELSATEQSTLTAQVEGEVLDIRVRAGMNVKRGELLASFATRELNQKVATQEAQLAKSREQLAFQKQQLARNRDLLAQKFISQNAYDNAASQLAVQEADVKASEAQLALARQSLDYAQVRAPIAGIVAERSIEPGQRVGFNTKLFTLVNLNELELKLQVPAAVIGHVKTGQNVSFTVDGIAGPLRATVARIAPVADAARNFAVFARIDNRKGALRGGMFARAELALGETTSAISIPAAAIREESGNTTVFVIENGRLARRMVETGLAANGMVQISKGLTAGETVIAAPLKNLTEGRAVTLPAGQR
jgi:RND family efflux transporter MFP subunit